MSPDRALESAERHTNSGRYVNTNRVAALNSIAMWMPEGIAMALIMLAERKDDRAVQASTSCSGRARSRRSSQPRPDSGSTRQSRSWHGSRNDLGPLCSNGRLRTAVSSADEGPHGRKSWTPSRRSGSLWVPPRPRPSRSLSTRFGNCSTTARRHGLGRTCHSSPLARELAKST